MYLTWLQKVTCLWLKQTETWDDLISCKAWEVRSSSSMDGRLQMKKTSQAELMWWLSFIWVITDQLLQHDIEGTALWWVGATSQTSHHNQCFWPRAMLSDRIKVITSYQPILVQKVQVDVISCISHLLIPCHRALFNYYGHAELKHGLPKHLVYRHVNDACTA